MWLDGFTVISMMKLKPSRYTNVLAPLAFLCNERIKVSPHPNETSAKRKTQCVYVLIMPHVFCLGWVVILGSCCESGACVSSTHTCLTGAEFPTDRDGTR